MNKEDYALIFIIVLVIFALLVGGAIKGERDARANELRWLTRGAEAGCIAVLHLRGELDGIMDCAEAVWIARESYPNTDLMGILGGAK